MSTSRTLPDDQCQRILRNERGSGVTRTLQPTCYPYDCSTVTEDGKLLDGSSRHGEARTRLNSALGLFEGDTLRFGEMDELLYAAVLEATEGRELSDVELAEAAKELVPATVESEGATLYATLLERMNAMLASRAEDADAFRVRLFGLWGDVLRRLEAYLVISFEVGESYAQQYRNDSAFADDHLFDALVRLHARTVHIGMEVLELLKAGFADGAHARWRTAHEVAVVAHFLKKSGTAVAERYLLHEHIESYKAALQHNEFSERLGQERISDAELQEMKDRRDELVDTYGSPFKEQYGWAAEALSKDRPNFADLEKAVALDHWRPYYKMASHNVHANRKGASFRLGLPPGDGALLAGPSTIGLGDPAHCIAISLLHSNVALLLYETTMESLMTLHICQRFVKDIGVEVMEVVRVMDGDDGEDVGVCLGGDEHEP